MHAAIHSTLILCEMLICWAPRCARVHGVPRQTDVDHQARLVQAQSCSTYTSEATCTAKQVPYSGLATVINATIEFTVTLSGADVANFTQALTQALALRCCLFINHTTQRTRFVTHAVEHLTCITDTLLTRPQGKSATPLWSCLNGLLKP